jgi:hypothetical protein
MEKQASDIKQAPAWFEPDGCSHAPPRREFMSGMRELIDTELDSVCGGHHGHHGHHGQHGGITGLFGKLGNIVNFGNLVIQENIAVQIAVAVGANASAFNLLGGQLNSSSIAA